MTRKWSVFRYVLMLLAFSFSLNIFYEYRATALFECSSATILGDNGYSSQTMQIELSCLNASYFFSSGENNANSEDLANINLNGINPNAAIINSNKLLLSFNQFYVDETDIPYSNLVLTINAESIIDEIGEKNVQTIITSNFFTDQASPFSNDDGYQISGDFLSIDYNDGLLKNDMDYESGIEEIIITTEPIYGTLLVNNDGSFSYSYLTGIKNVDDQFKYITKDYQNNLSNETTVHINDALPSLTSHRLTNYSRTGEQGYAKPGDELTVEFSTSEKVILDEIKIGNIIVNVGNETGDNFSFSYTLSDIDVSGDYGYNISFYDESNNPASFQYFTGETTILFDKLSPKIELLGNQNIEMEVYESIDIYEDIVACDIDENDDCIESLDILSSGEVNFDKPGQYEVSFWTVDKAGNISEIIYKNIKVVDSLNDRLTNLSNSLNNLGYNNNFSSITIDNCENFDKLFVEYKKDDKKVFRIDFTDEINFNDFDLIEFFEQIEKYLYSNSFGEFVFDLSTLYDKSTIIKERALITFYNLNQIGYSNGSSINDLINNLSIYDENDLPKDVKKIVINFISYSKCVNDEIDCYSFSFSVNDFSKYIIKQDSISPVVTINNLKTHKIGEKISLSGRIDDEDVELVLSINNSKFSLTKSNIKDGVWHFEIDSNNWLAGDYVVSISATDFANNQTITSTKLKIIEEKVDIIDTILQGTANFGSIIYDTSEEISSIHKIKDDIDQQILNSTNQDGLSSVKWYRPIVIGVVAVIFLVSLLELIKQRVD